ncbi:hypothetical protein [Chryseobacterium sp. A321]
MDTNKKFFAQMLKKLSPLRERLKKHPEKVLGFLLLVLLFALAINLAQYKYFLSKEEKERRDFLVAREDTMDRLEYRNKMSLKRERLRPELRRTIQSLQSYLTKEKEGELTQVDSLEMDRLYTQYKTLLHAYQSDSL